MIGPKKLKSKNKIHQSDDTFKRPEEKLENKNVYKSRTSKTPTVTKKPTVAKKDVYFKTPV